SRGGRDVATVNCTERIHAGRTSVRAEWAPTTEAHEMGGRPLCRGRGGARVSLFVRAGEPAVRRHAGVGRRVRPFAAAELGRSGAVDLDGERSRRRLVVPPIGRPCPQPAALELPSRSMRTNECWGAAERAPVSGGGPRATLGARGGARRRGPGAALPPGSVGSRRAGE